MARKFAHVRYSAVIQLILAGLMVVFGIINRLITQNPLSNVYYGIWVGLWVLITSVLGYLASRIARPVNWALVWSYMGFSITAAVFCSSMIIAYSMELAYMDYYYYHYYGDGVYYSEQAKVAISVIVLILSIAEFGISIYSSVSCCTAQGCTCCQATPQGDTNQGGFPAGVAVAYSGGGVQVPTVPTSMGTMTAVPSVPTSMGTMTAVPSVPTSIGDHDSGVHASNRSTILHCSDVTIEDGNGVEMSQFAFNR